MKRSRFVALWCIVAITGATVIQHQARADDPDEVQLPPLLVTGGLTPVVGDESGRAYTVVTAEKLKENQTRYVADALRQVPGFQVSRTGSFGGLTQIRVRGAEGNHVLVLVNGVEVSEVSQGEFDFGSLQVADIDRIEVLRGPQSAFWGSNAMAGVINIITKSGIRNGFKVTLRSEGGTDGTALGSGVMQGGGEFFDIAISASHRKTDGFNISDFGSEEDGDRNTVLNSKLHWDINSQLSLTATGRYVDRRSDTDAQDFAFPTTPTQGLVIDTDDQTASEELFGSVELVWTSPDKAWTQKLFGTAGGSTRENFQNGTRTSGNKGNRYKVRYQATHSFDAPAFADSTHQISGGYEWKREEFRQVTPVFDPSQLDTRDRSLHGIVGEYRGAFADTFFLNAAVRQDFNNRFDDATTYSVSAAWFIQQTGTRIHASLGEGVTNPTFFEQFGFIPARFNGTASLKPEQSFGWDAGIKQTLLDGRLVFDVTYFNQDLTNEITTIFPPPTFIATPINLNGKSKREGIEIAATAQLFEGMTVTGTYTYTKSVDANGQTEVRRPKHSGSLNAVYTFAEGNAQLFATAIFNGKSEDLEFITATPNTRVTLDDYATVNLGGRYRINDRLEAFARVENLFNEKYEEVFGFNTQGRTAFFGISGTLP